MRQPPPGALARRIDHLCRLNTSGVRAGARGVASALQATRSSKLGRDTHTPLHRFRVGVRLCADTQTDMLPGEPGGAICVQSFDDSLNSAIRTTYRISLRSSSLREPRYPLLEVVMAIRMRGREAAHIDSRMWGLGVVKCSRRPESSRKADRMWFARWVLDIAVMILPQVHLRKPCYDFSFL